MTAPPQTHRAQTAQLSRQASGAYLIGTLVPAVTAALAAFTTVSLGSAPWIMFMGWVAYFTRPNPKDGAQTFVCVAVGIALGALATLTTGALAPALGDFALPLVVFVVACLVIAARGLPVLNNLLGYFIGLITFFAAHREPSLVNLAVLAALAALGFGAGLLAMALDGWAARVIDRRRHTA